MVEKMVPASSVIECCPYCTEEVELRGELVRQACPKCQQMILPCSACEMQLCSECPADASAENQPEPIVFESERMKRILEKDGFIKSVFNHLSKRNPDESEDSILEIVFNSYILGHGEMRDSYLQV